MDKHPKMTRQQAIEELRREAEELEKPSSIAEYARNQYRARIRRRLADKLELELNDSLARVFHENAEFWGNIRASPEIA